MGSAAGSVCRAAGDAVDDNTTSVPFDRDRSRLFSAYSHSWLHQLTDHNVLV